MTAEPQSSTPIRARVLPDQRDGNPYQQLLADSVARAGIESTFVTDYYRGLPVYRDWRANGRGTQIYHLHWLSNYIRFEDYPRKLFYTLKLLLDLRLLRAKGVRIVWTVHNLVSHEARYARLEKWTSRKVAGFADGLIVHSESARRAASETYGIPPEAFTVIPHGHYQSVYEEPPSRTDARNQLELPVEKDAPVVLCFGFMRPYKGIEDLIRAWKRIAKTSNAHLVIAGKAIDENYLQQLEDLAGDDPSIRLIEGYVDPAMVPVYFAAADVAALPFRKILTSGSLLLALGFGKPVIVPRVALTEEVLEGCPSFYFVPGSGDQGLENALREALATELPGAREAVLERARSFDWDHIGQLTADLYRSVLSTEHASRPANP
jgi:glycosyltransferase involved in cell wall biosynthesis